MARKHIEAVGQAIWLFLWLIDKTTSEELADGERWGVVLYGKTLTAKQMAGTLFVNERTARRYLSQLEKGGYIRLMKKSDGYTIYVRKSIKWQNRPGIKSVPNPGRQTNAFERLAQFVREGGE